MTPGFKPFTVQQYLWQISWESPYGPSFQCFNYERQRGPVGLQNSLYFCVFKCARTVRRVGQAHFALRYAKPILRKKKPDCFAVYSRVVSESDSQFGGTRFESCFDHFLDLLSGRSEFKSSATPVNNQLVASCQMGFCYVLFELFISKYLSGVPVKLVGYTKRTFRYKQIIIYQISLSE